MKMKSLTTRISIIVSVLTLLVLMATLLTVYTIAANNHRKEAAQETQFKLELMMERLSKVQTTVELTATYSVPALKACMDDTMAVMRVLTNIVETNQYVNSAALAYAPNRLPDHPYCMPIAANYGTVSHFFSDKEHNGEYIYEDWYIAPSIEGISFWTDPYFNTLDVPVVSYAVPVKSEEHGFEGVLTLAIELTNLNKLLALNQSEDADSLAQKPSGCVIFDRNTTFLTTSSSEYIMNETLFTLAESKNDTVHSHIGREIVAHRDGEEILNIEGEKSVVTWRVLPKIQWTAMVVTPYSEVFASLNQLTLVTVIVALIAAIAAIIFLYFSVRRALRPIKRLKSATHLLGDGNYDTELPYRLTSRQDEIGDLGREFMRMEKAVKSNIDQLEEERQRVKDSFSMLDTLVHNVISHLRLPINNMISFVDALSSFVDNKDETKMLKDEAKNASVTILQQFNQLNQMANLVSAREEDADLMLISSEEFIEDVMKGVRQLEERYLLTIDATYQDKRTIKIRTNTLALETLLFQLVVEASRVSKTNVIELSSRLNQDQTALRILIDAKTSEPIPAEEKSSFFKRFAQQKINAYASGNNLQLYICYQAAKHLGARLYVDTAYTEGNRFVLDIKRAD